MTALTIAADISAAFPDARIATITCQGLRSGDDWPEAEAMLAQLEQAVAEDSWLPADEADPRVADWHATYRSFGTNPRRERPSIDALGRRLRKSGRVPRICGPVDAYNAISLQYALPAGAIDLSAVHGDIQIRRATAGDTFTPLGSPGTTEHPKAGEVVYADDTSVLTRHWNHRDADRTKVDASSSSAVFLLETIDTPTHGAALDQAARQLQELLSLHCTAACLRYIDAAVPTAQLTAQL